jgi:hypothetical protein
MLNPVKINFRKWKEIKDYSLGKQKLRRFTIPVSAPKEIAE